MPLLSFLTRLLLYTNPFLVFTLDHFFPATLGRETRHLVTHLRRVLLCNLNAQSAGTGALSVHFSHFECSFVLITRAWIGTRLK